MLDLEAIEAKRKNAKLFNQNAVIEPRLMAVCTVNCTMHEHLTKTERQITALKTQLDETQLAFEKLTGELF